MLQLVSEDIHNESTKGRLKKMAETIAELKCPHCGKVSPVEMPTTLSLLRLRCDGCGETILNKEGDCCVFCSHSELECPPMQEKASGRWFSSSPLHLRDGEGPDSEGVACYMVG